MDMTLFSTLLRNLLHVQVHYDTREEELLGSFAEKYCYNPALQPLFTLQALKELTAQAEDHTFYGVQDALGICLLFFRLEDRIVLVGPYVRSEFSEAKVQAVLLRQHFPASYAASLRLYYSAFPLTGSTHLRSAVLACIHALSGTTEEYSYCRLRSDAPEQKLPQPQREESLDYSALHRRYDVENRFLHMIETGDVENVLIAQRQMSLAGMGQTRYVNAVYMDSGTGLAMLRAMARKAAERGGASLVEIHEITQRAVQRIYASKNAKEQGRYSDEMILELTEAVRRARLQLDRYSPPIRRVIEHIELNYSQRLPLEELAAVSHLSPAYLSRSFKQEAGVNLSQYLEHLRCEKAAEMLRSSDAAVQEISSYVGYLDNNYFVKVFKKQFGLTPTEYRAGQR